MELPLNFVERSYELFFQYQIPPGKHVLKFKITNPNKKSLFGSKEYDYIREKNKI